MFFSRARSWAVQRVSNLGLVALLCLMFFALWYDSAAEDSPQRDHRSGSRQPYRGKFTHHRAELSTSQLIFVYYTLIAHFVGLLFPIRLCWAVRSITANLRKVALQVQPQVTQTKPISGKLAWNLPRSNESVSSYEDSISSDQSESDIELSTSTSIESWEDETLIHSIILPNYKEDMDTLRETLDVLACHALASASYEIYLAMEAGEIGCEAKAAILEKEYGSKFRSIEHTVHPRDIQGEAQGKSSNLRWAALYINGKYPEQRSKSQTIVTVMDSDSHLMSKYFSLINGMHFAYPKTADTTMYVPPIIMDRNAHHVPRLVRVADLLWAGAGLSGHYETSSICPPTSVYSLPLSLVDRAGGWDAGEDSIGEDLHMYIKCYFALNGNLTTRSIFSAASHSNVHSSGKGIRGFFQDIKARYKQALRHMWGALDSGFALKSIEQMWWNPRSDTCERPNWLGCLVLLHRMYEAHFLPIHITLLLFSSALYTFLTPAQNIPRLMQQAIDITGYMRFVSFLEFVYFFFLYERFHLLCLSAREEEMRRAGLADRMADAFSYRSWKKTGADFILFPVAGLMFGTVPAMVALVSQFWSLRLVYKVTAKPQRGSLVFP